ncbi:MAG TPA: nucleoside deaminase [Xanthomonadales bacterium]|nr:nucleoside deaminase [Xanthomonadales bacterium]
MAMQHGFSIELPEWVLPWLSERHDDLASEPGRMGLVIALARENVRTGSGGPFAAAVFNSADDSLISVGVNLVTNSGLSMAHAEMLALSLAQKAMGDWDLANRGELSLVTSCEPCAMCFGAVPWSGVRSLVCGARKEDAEAGGFDEGDKPGDWADSLRARGIAVRQNVMRAEAAEVFDFYREQGGVIYNSGGEGGDQG